MSTATTTIFIFFEIFLFVLKKIFQQQQLNFLLSIEFLPPSHTSYIVIDHVESEDTKKVEEHTHTETMFRLARQITNRRCIEIQCRRGVMSNRQLKRRVPVKRIRDELAKQRRMEENPRPLQFTPDGDVSKLPFNIRRAGPAQNLPVYLGT